MKSIIKKFIQKQLSLVKKSCNDKYGKTSSGRVSSYYILFTIIFGALVFIGIDVANAVVAIIEKGSYVIPGSHMGIYGMILAHHLALLGINKNGETQLEKASKKQENKEG